MTRKRMKAVAALAAAGCVVALVALSAAPAARHVRTDTFDWTPVGQALGIPGTLQAGGVYRIDIPRTDLKVRVDGKHKLGLEDVNLRTAFALGGYLVFLPMGSGPDAMMMGDLVLTEDEIEPVMLSLEQHGVDVSAIHNHLLWEKPTVMYMHVMVMGDAVQLATAVHNALALTHTPLKPTSPKPHDLEMGGLDKATQTAIDGIIGVPGKLGPGVYKFSIAPTYTITSGGMTIPPSMGMSTGLTFQPVGHHDAAVTGDFALRGNQVNPVIRALRSHGIYITALHSHMLDATPTVFFMHFLATGNPLALAHGLRAGLDAIAANPPA